MAPWTKARTLAGTRRVRAAPTSNAKGTKTTSWPTSIPPKKRPSSRGFNVGRVSARLWKIP